MEQNQLSSCYCKAYCDKLKYMICGIYVIIPALWKHRLKQWRCFSIIMGAFMPWGLQIEDVFSSCIDTDLLAEICSVGQWFVQEGRCYPWSLARGVLPQIYGPMRAHYCSARAFAICCKQGGAFSPVAASQDIRYNAKTTYL